MLLEYTGRFFMLVCVCVSAQATSVNRLYTRSHPRKAYLYACHFHFLTLSWHRLDAWQESYNLQNQSDEYDYQDLRELIFVGVMIKNGEIVREFAWHMCPWHEEYKPYARANSYLIHQKRGNWTYSLTKLSLLLRNFLQTPCTYRVV